MHILYFTLSGGGGSGTMYYPFLIIDVTLSEGGGGEAPYNLIPPANRGRRRDDFVTS
jgi:hypothetical protein